jgi:hypothetical protein
MSGGNTRQLYETLTPGDPVEVTHIVKVGFRDWITKTTGTVVRKARERHSLHFRRAADEQVYRDILVLRRDDGELTTVTLDGFTTLNLLNRPVEATAHGG